MKIQISRTMVDNFIYGASLGAGVFAGFMLGETIARKRLERDFDERVKAEVAASKKFYHVLQAKEMFDSPQEALKALREIKLEDPMEVVEDLIEEYSPESTDEMVEIARNVFVESGVELDIENEVRHPDVPYVIEHDEFFNSDFETLSLMYYTEDGVLADERDDHIPDVDGIVGEDNLQRFGHGSRDNNIVYVRNERLQTDFEIVRAEGSYSEQVLGVIQHEDKPRLRKFRTYEE